MSRIHEALKRAEQEAASKGNGANAANASDSAAAPPPAPGISVVDRHPGASRVAPPAPITMDALLACAQAEWSPDPQTMLFFNADEKTCGTEQFRTLRSRLYQLREEEPLKKILITSALPKEGKSFVAANLAQAIVRQHGRRALLIDADLRAARLHIALGTKAKPGLSEDLSDEAQVLNIIQRGPMDGLFFIPSGRETTNPAELLAGDHFRSLLEQLEALFDWIIIDSPPAVP